MEGVYAPHCDPVMISTQVGIWRIERTLIEEVCGSNILFLNFFERIKLPQDVIIAITGDMYGFDRNKSNTISRVPQDILLTVKTFTCNFILMDLKSPYNAILGRLDDFHGIIVPL